MVSVVAVALFPGQQINQIDYTHVRSNSLDNRFHSLWSNALDNCDRFILSWIGCMLDNERVMFSHSLSLFHFALWIRWLTELYTNEHIFHQFDHYPLPNMVFLPSPIEKKFHGIKFICQSFISYKCIYLWQALQSIPWHLLFKQFYDNIILEKHKKFCYVRKRSFDLALIIDTMTLVI